MNKKTLFSILLSFCVLPAVAFAQVTIQSLMDAAVDTTLYIAGGVVVILWIITGFLFLTAQGAPEKLSSAKKALIAAVAGTLLVILAASAIWIVSSAFHITPPAGTPMGSVGGYVVGDGCNITGGTVGSGTFGANGMCCYGVDPVRFCCQIGTDGKGIGATCALQLSVGN